MDTIIIVGICVGLPVMIPIIAMFLKHQRNMAEITHRAGVVENAAIEQLHREMKTMRDDFVEHSLSVERNYDALCRRLDHMENDSLRARGN